MNDRKIINQPYSTTFYENEELFTKLIEADLHKQKNANVILSFDPDGNLAKIKIEKVVYHHGKEK